MKKVFLIFLLLSVIIQLSAQTKLNDTIQLVSSYSPQQGMRLKWLPTSFEVFSEGFRNGFNIYRAEIQSVNNTEKRGDFIKINDQPVSHWSMERIRFETGKDSALATAQLFINGADEFFNNKGGATVREAVEKSEGKDLIHLLGAFATINNNKVAEALGMFFKDKDYNPGKKYLYKIEIPGKEIFTSYLLVFPFKGQPREKVMGLTLQLYPGVVHLSWFNNKNRNYPYYNIYRSEKKNSGYVKLNRIPYAGDIGNARMDEKYTSYTDSFPAYNKTYYYKIVGINAFEEEGIPSDVREVRTDYLLKTSPVISETESPDNKIINLKWVVDPEEKKYIKGYTVKRARRGEGPYRQLHKGQLSASTFSFTDKSDKMSSNYYVVTAYGSSGDSISSLLKAHILVDSVPPVKPVMLSGKCDTNGVVTIIWKRNKDEDLEGYRIFKTSSKDQEPERVLPGHISDTTLKDTINLKRPYNKIYYRIVALDNVFNSSVPSEFLEIILPDKNPPANGYLKSYSSGVNGIHLDWQPSNAYDLKRMYLLRKGEMDLNFLPLLVLQGDSLRLSSFTDTTVKGGITYQYALEAEDEAGLKSGISDVFSVEQLKNLEIRFVKNLEGIANRQNQMIKLTWDFPYNATGFRIYRGRNNEPLTTYEYISGDKREFYDSWLKPNSKYKYQIVAELSGGFTSGFSNVIEVKY
jgi:uncharacterized protein